MTIDFANGASPRRVAAVAVLLLVYIGIWLYLTPYDGLNHDAQGYAVGGLAALHSDQLSGDLFLRFRSQEEFSVFPRIDAYFIRILGLDMAAAVLTLVGQVLWYGVAFLLLRKLSGKDAALLGLGLLITTPAIYGGQRVFHLAEPFLTARLPAEILSLTAIWAWLSGKRLVAGIALVAGMLVHPLMAFPAALLIGMDFIADRTSSRMLVLVTLAGTAAAVAGSYVIGAAAPEMQGRWLAMTELRSGFLFPTQWNTLDWNYLMQSLLTLATGIVALRDTRASRLMQAAILLGLAGLALSFFYSMVSPLKILIGGQPWRWLWPARFLAIGALPAIVAALWSGARMSRASGLVLVAGWLFVVPLSSHSAAVMMTGAALAGLALLMSLAATRASDEMALLSLRSAWVLLAVVLAATSVTSSLAWRMANEVQLSGAGFAGHVANVLRLITPATMLAMACGLVVLAAWTPLRGAVVAAVGIGLVATAAPSAVQAWSATPYTGAKFAEFSDWRARIPVDSEVLWWERLRETWFLLHRRAYLTRSQSGGVVYSPELADEIVRRALVLQPLIDRNFWVGGHPREDFEPAPLTSQRMVEICSDPMLGFVVSDVDLGLGAPRKQWPDAGSTIYLYDCGRFRTPGRHVE